MLKFTNRVKKPTAVGGLPLPASAVAVTHDEVKLTGLKFKKDGSVDVYVRSRKPRTINIFTTGAYIFAADAHKGKVGREYSACAHLLALSRENPDGKGPERVVDVLKHLAGEKIT